MTQITSDTLIATSKAIASFYPDGINAIRSMTVDDQDQLHVVGRDDKKIIEFTFAPDLSTCQYKLVDDGEGNLDSDEEEDCEDCSDRIDTLGIKGEPLEPEAIRKLITIE